MLLSFSLVVCRCCPWPLVAMWLTGVLSPFIESFTVLVLGILSLGRFAKLPSESRLSINCPLVVSVGSDGTVYNYFTFGRGDYLCSKTLLNIYCVG